MHAQEPPHNGHVLPVNTPSVLPMNAPSVLPVNTPSPPPCPPGPGLPGQALEELSAALVMWEAGSPRISGAPGGPPGVTGGHMPDLEGRSRLMDLCIQMGERAGGGAGVQVTRVQATRARAGGGAGVQMTRVQATRARAGGREGFR